ncbi:glutamyl-tRNA reductase [Halobacteriales archaeon Cl-PHB]
MCAATREQTDATDADSDGESLPDSVERLAAVGVTCETHATPRLGDFAPDDPVALAREVRARDRVTEAVVLSTCNRVEVFVSARRPADVDQALAAARDVLGSPAEANQQRGLAAVEYVCRVACGLESKIVGEDHVLGQVNRAREAAAEADLATGSLGRAMELAVSVGRTCREETAINEGHVGYGSATCELIGELTTPDRLVVVGAGEMAESVAKAAGHRWEARVDVVNRSPAPELPSEDGTRWPLADLGEALADADAAVTATGAHEPVVGSSEAGYLDLDAPVVDLANPRDVAEPVRETHRVVSLDAVQARVDATAERRRAAVPSVEERLAAALDRYVAAERENRAEDTLRALHREAATVRERELDRARQRLAEGEAPPEAVLEEFASAFAGSLLGTPTDRLREAAREGDDAVIDAVHRLFDLSVESEDRS